MAYESELAAAIDAVRKAAHLTHKVAKGTQISAIQKEDKSPVTIADFGAQAIINSAIHAKFPNDPIVGEEDSHGLHAQPALAAAIADLAHEFSPDDPRFDPGSPNVVDALCEAIDLGNFEGCAKGRQWALDPVDGTKGFLRGGQYAVCLALIVDSTVQLGVIACPNLGSSGGLFYAVRGQGGFRVSLYGSEGADPRALKFREISHVSEAQFCESVEAGHSALGRQNQVARLLGLRKPAVRMDSQAKYCELARGEADIYLRLPVHMSYEEKIWDHAAGSLLITEAGGLVSDMYGQPLDFGQGRTLRQNKGIVASSRMLQPRILAVLGETGSDYDSFNDV